MKTALYLNSAVRKRQSTGFDGFRGETVSATVASVDTLKNAIHAKDALLQVCFETVHSGFDAEKNSFWQKKIFEKNQSSKT